jgi:predicted PurR-regulated permease PerM
MLATLKKSISGWMFAEVKLAILGFGLMAVGFWLLGISRSLVLAGLIAILDAFPVLGVGTVLIPWALLCLLREETIRGIGLLALYAVVWLSRSILEPRLIGKGLGLDPLVTLMAIYAGWKLWGISGMLLAPILALTVAQVLTQWRVES